MFDLVQSALVRRDPGAAMPIEPSAEDGAARAAAPPMAASLTSRAEIASALSSAIAYFEAMEPSSPAVLLIRQARQLVGKNLFEVMQILVPAHAEAARIPVGAEPAFLVPVSALTTGTGDVDTQESDAEASEREEGGETGGEGRAGNRAGSRQAALALLDQVAAQYRMAEPSSPIPLLLDRAKSLSSRDFLTLLKDLLSEDTLQTMKLG
jgi:type VI secretion system protein ImpA